VGGIPAYLLSPPAHDIDALGDSQRLHRLFEE
jgi:hypothetical protein